jgi:hypothetical protein
MEQQFCFKLHDKSGSVLLAVCDSELLGKTLKFGDVDFEISASFYGEEKADAGQVLDMIERCNVANVIGREIVDLLAGNGIIDRKSVMRASRAADKIELDIPKK